MRLIDPEELKQGRELRKVKVPKREVKDVGNEEAREEGFGNVRGEMLFEVKLPSRGKHGYPEVLKVRPLKVADVKPLIATRVIDEIGYIRRVIEAIGKTIMEPVRFNIKDLTLEDLVKLIVAHRINSFGRHFDVLWDCQNCGKKGQLITIDLMGLEERYISDEYPGDPVELESGVKARYPRVSVFFGEGISSLDDVSELDLVADAVVGVSVDELSLKEYGEVVDFISEWVGSYGVQAKVKVRCNSCGEEGWVELPFFLFLARK